MLVFQDLRTGVFVSIRSELFSDTVGYQSIRAEKERIVFIKRYSNYERLNFAERNC